MGFADQLEQQFRTNARVQFDRALAGTLAELRAKAPRDTSELANKLEIRNRSVTSAQLRAQITSGARNQGFDYPLHLEKARRIAPTKAKFLRFEVRGRVVYSKGFDNIHHLWWTKAWGLASPPTLWDQQVAKAFSGGFF